MGGKASKLASSRHRLPPPKEPISIPPSQSQSLPESESNNPGTESCVSIGQHVTDSEASKSSDSIQACFSSQSTIAIKPKSFLRNGMETSIETGSDWKETTEESDTSCRVSLGFTLFLAEGDSPAFQLSVSITDSINELELQCNKALSITPPYTSKLFLGTRRLVSGTRLEDYPISQEECLHVCVTDLDCELPLYVMTPSKRIIPVAAMYWDDVRSVKAAIQEIESVSATEMTLKYAGRTLTDSDILTYCGLQRESTLQLEYKSREITCEKYDDFFVYINDTAKTEVMSVRCDKESTVNELKTRISQIAEIAPQNQKLIFHGAALPNEKALSACCVSRESMIFLVHQSPREIRLFIRTEANELFTVDCDRSQQVSTIISMVKVMKNIYVDRLEFDSKPLRENKAISDYEIGNGSVVCCYSGCAFLRVYVKSDKLLEFSVGKKDKIAVLKRKIANIPDIYQIFKLGDLELDCDGTFELYQIETNTIIDLEVRKRDEINLFFRYDGKQMAVLVPKNGLVDDINAGIYALTGIPPEQQILRYNNRHLRMNTPISQWELAKDSNLDLKLGQLLGGSKDTLFVPTEFASTKNFIRLSFSTTADRWRRIRPGISFRTKCLSNTCVAGGKFIYVVKAFGKFNIAKEAITLRCPECNQSAEASTNCVLYKACWRFEGRRDDKQVDEEPWGGEIGDEEQVATFVGTTNVMWRYLEVDVHVFSGAGF